MDRSNQLKLIILLVCVDKKEKAIKVVWNSVHETTLVTELTYSLACFSKKLIFRIAKEVVDACFLS